MALRDKTLVLVGTTLLGLIVILYIASQTILLSGFAELEEREARQNVERVRETISSRLDDLSSKAGDWANWDDTYRFVRDGNRSFVQTNPTDETFKQLRINLVLIVNTAGRTVYGKAFDLKRDRQAPLPAGLEEHTSSGKLLLKHRDAHSHFEGILSLPQAPMLVASRPILTSQGTGPIRGTLLMGRYLDDSEVIQVGKNTHVALTLIRFTDSDIPSELRAVSGTLASRNPVLIQALHERFISSYQLVRDVYGKPALVLRADMPRNIYRQGQASIRYFVVWLLAAGLVFALLTLGLLERSVLLPMTSLDSSVNRIATTGNLSARVDPPAKNELGSLAESINAMLDALERSVHGRQESETRYRAVVEQSSDGIFLIEADTKQIIEANAAGQTLLGYGPQEILGLTVHDIVGGPPEDVDAQIARVLEKKRHFIGELPCRRKGGTLVDAELSATLIAYGGRQALCVVVRDISERKRAEAELERHREHLEELVEERTAELRASNERLELEIVERGQTQQALHGAVEELDAERKRMEELAKKTIEVQESERQYLASEIHDDLLQGLVATSYFLQMINAPDKRTAERKEKLIEILRATIDRGRALISEIEPIREPEIGLIPAIKRSIDIALAGTSIDVDFVRPKKLPAISLAAKTNILRIVQEALMNARKHSQATELSLKISTTKGRLVVEIKDNGKGFDLEAVSGKIVGHYGLLAMKERAHLVDGELTVASTPGNGTTLKGTFPLG